MQRQRHLFDQILWIGGEKTASYFQNLKEELWEMTGSIFPYLQVQDGTNLKKQHIFADTNGWIICLDDILDVKYYLELISKQRGNHWVVLLINVGEDNSFLQEFAQKNNIILYYDILLGQPIMDFVRDLVEASKLFSQSGNVKLLISEKQSLYFMKGENHTQYLTYMSKLASYCGIRDITLRSDQTDQAEHVSYSFFMNDEKGDMIAHSSATITSNEVFAIDAIECLHSIADKYPLTTNAVIGNSHRFAWFPNIKGV